MLTTQAIVKNVKRGVIALGLSVGVLAVPLSAPAAHAQVGVIGGCGNVCGPAWTISNTPGGTVTNVDCVGGRITVYASASANSGWVNGQYATYRYNLQSNAGHNITSGWSSALVLPYSAVVLGSLVYYPLASLPTAQIPAARGLSWTVQVQYGFWFGSSYRYTAFAGPADGGYSNGGVFRYWSRCYT